MKKLFFGLVVVSMALMACNQDEDLAQTIVEQTVASEDMTNAQNLAIDAEEQVDEQLELLENELQGSNASSRNACVEITVEQPWGIFPNTVTLDFGDGCTGPKGRTRTGKIIVVISDTLKNTGATRTLTFDEFFIDEVNIEGQKILTNQGLNNEEQPYFTRQTQIQINYPNGTSASWNSNYTVTQTGGLDAPVFYDNVYEITGSSSGVNRNDVPFTTTINQALVKEIGCPWIVSGVIILTVNDKDRSIDYGEGACDNKATITFANGNTKQIILFKKWWM